MHLIGSSLSFLMIFSVSAKCAVYFYIQNESGWSCHNLNTSCPMQGKVEQIGAKNDRNAAFCDEELRFDYKAKYYRSKLCDPGEFNSFLP